VSGLSLRAEHRRLPLPVHSLFCQFQLIRNSVFADVMAHDIAMVGVAIKAARVARSPTWRGQLFLGLGVRPIQGRAFNAEEETPGRFSSRE
jgi:hypothetical protein